MLTGSLFGARVLGAARSSSLRTIFMWVIVALGVEMIYNGVTGRLR